MRLKRYILAGAALLAAFVAIAEIEKSDLDSRTISKKVASYLPVLHLNQLPMDDYVATNALSLYLESLDPARSFFLQSDIDAFELEATDLDNQLKKGNTAFATNVFSILIERMSNRVDYVNELLETGFDTTVEEDFLWDRKDASWPQDEADWNELWRKRVKNEYVARIVAKEVYTEEEDPAAASNTVAEVTEEMDSTNTVAETEDEYEYDQEAEDALRTPEEFIRERYKQFLLTMESFDDEMILQRYLTAFSHVYDPHSDYMSPSSVEDFNINMKLSLVGIGAMLRSEDGMAKIMRVIPGGPADKDGRLKAGDKIIAVAQGDEEPVSILHWPLYKSVRLIRGEKDTTVVLTIIPASDRTGTRTKKLDIVRDEVKLEEQAAKGEVKKVELPDGESRNLGVITLPDFYADFKATQNHEEDARRASVDVRRLLNELKAEGVEGMVLDLRNNGGGSLMEAIEMAGLFISSGPIVQVKQRRGVEILPDADPEVEYGGPLVILINRLSASASEILAAALQDYNRAIIVGDQRTHGKGTVQTLLPLERGEKNRRGSLKLTTAGFYRINGGSTQLKGVTPDVIIPSYLDVMDLGEDSLKHALPWDSVRPALFRAAGDIEPFIPVLGERSAERLENDSEFATYFEKRDRLKKRFETKTVSLNLEQRIAEAAAEKELDDIQNETFDMADDEENEDIKDIVLDEALNILSDLIDLKRNPPQEELVKADH